MNKLLDLATGFEESSRQQLKNSNEALRIALQHETLIENSLMASAQNISGDMASQNEQLQQQSAALMQTYQTILTQHSQQLAEMEQAFIQQNTAFKEKIRQSEKNLYRLAARPLLWVVIGGLMGAFFMMAGIGMWLAMDKNEKLQASIQGTDTGIAAAAKEYPWDTDHQLSVGQWWHSALRGSRSDSASMGQEWRVPV